MEENTKTVAEDTEMEDCDGEKVVTMMDVLKEQEDFENNANAVLGASDEKNCTYSKGYIKRQAIYACITCCSGAKDDPSKRAGVCLACSLTCHENHELIELYTKRNFRCDCGNPKFNSNPCQYTPNKSDLNENNEYNQNFSGLYCVCHRPYPDLESTIEDEMIQCIICEDWLHANHLEANVPSNDQYSEMICKGCMEKNLFLHDYSSLAVNVENDVDVEVDIPENTNFNGNHKTNDELEKSSSHLDECAEKEKVPVINDSNECSSKDDNVTVQDSNIMEKGEQSYDTTKEKTQLEDECMEEDRLLADSEEEEKLKNNKMDGEYPEIQDKTNDLSMPTKDGEIKEQDDGGEIKEKDDGGEIKEKDDGGEIKENGDGGEIKEKDDGGEIKEKDDDGEIKEKDDGGEIKENDDGGEIKEKDDGGEIKEKDDGGEIKELEEGKIENEVKDCETQGDIKNNTDIQTNKEDNVNNENIETFETSNSKVNLEAEVDQTAEKSIQEKDLVDNDLNLNSAENESNHKSSDEKEIKVNIEIKNNTDNIETENTNEESNKSEETTSENKRKLPIEENTVDSTISGKRVKLDSCCIRPKNVKKIYKGATFWSSDFRQKLCTCNECLIIYKDLSVLFLTDFDDTVTAYESLGEEKERIEGKPASQYEKGLQALSSLDRVQQINALTEYNKMKDKLLDFLKTFKERKEVVKEEDIKEFFAGMKPKREPDGVYFCR